VGRVSWTELCQLIKAGYSFLKIILIKSDFDTETLQKRRLLVSRFSEASLLSKAYHRATAKMVANKFGAAHGVKFALHNTYQSRSGSANFPLAARILPEGAPISIITASLHSNTTSSSQAPMIQL
jgi:hypothetical protein